MRVNNVRDGEKVKFDDDVEKGELELEFNGGETTDERRRRAWSVSRWWCQSVWAGQAREGEKGIEGSKGEEMSDRTGVGARKA